MQPSQPPLSTFSQLGTQSQQFLQPTTINTSPYVLQPTITSSLQTLQTLQPVSFVNTPPLTRNIPLIVSSNVPTILSTPIVRQKNNYVPFITRDPLNPFGAVLGTYQNLDDDKEIHKKVTSHVYNKLVKKWFYDSLLPLLAFVKTENGRHVLIKSMNEYNPQSVKGESVSEIERKIEYMQDKIITHKDLRHFLKKFVKHHDYHWYTLYTVEDKIKDELYKHLKKLLETAINEVSKSN
jgi:hypothetical protein